jgi:electron transfer flavoprotein alpha subunit
MAEAPPRIRRDPRNRPGTRPAASRGALTPASAETVLRVESPACHVLAVPALARGRLSRVDREVLGAARMLADGLGGAVVLLACLPPGGALAGDPAQAGADRVMAMRHAAFAADEIEARAAAVVAAARDLDARHILFADLPGGGGELGRLVAARLGGRPATAVMRLEAGTLSRVEDGGRQEGSGPVPRVVLLAPGRFAPVSPVPRREAMPLPAPTFEATPRCRDLGLLPADPATVPLAEAALIVGAGNGVTDWPAFHALAAALDAAEGGSRVVCDAGHLPRERQIGASGLVVEPRCYIALGISGASQHLQGIAGCERVVAVNSDPRAEMLRRADLALMADVQQVMPALLALVRERGDA